MPLPPARIIPFRFSRFGSSLVFRLHVNAYSIPQIRESVVLIGETNFGWVQPPIDAEVRIAVKNAPIIIRGIRRIHLVGEYGFLAQCHKSVGKTLGDKKLLLIFLGKLC